MRLFCSRSLGLLACVFFIADYSYSQLPAFPTAEGAGKFATGGRGTVSIAPKIFEVTTLADDATSATTPGTFRYACTNNSPSVPNRIIVFRVSGTIHLFAALSLNRANTTIAGQTAPGEGICIADYPVTIGANNMIIRYLRFRLGDKNQNKGMVNGSGDDDGFGDNGSGRQNIVIDHCTASWSDDESFTIYKGDNVTVQWCMITEPLNYSYHFESGDADFEQHGYGGIWGGAHASFHHNLIAHIKGRGPRFDGIRNIASENADFRNNVIYNWIDYSTNGGEGGNYNVVGNYYKWGPNTPSTSGTSTGGVNRRSMLVNPFKQTSTPVIAYGKFYLTGNYSDNSSAVTDNNWLGMGFSGGSLNDSTASKVTTAFNIIPINTQTAQDAYQSVLTNAGCFLPHRDTLDQRIINDVINRTGRVIDVQGGYAHGTPYSTSQTAWPALASGTPPTDTDHDGMPDSWETRRGLNPSNATDLNGYTSTSGYSNIENYLNGDTIVAAGVLNSCITAKTINAVNSGTWIHANDSTASYYLSSSYTAAIDSMNTVASVLDNGVFGGFTVSYYTTNTLRYDVYNHSYLNRNITITPGNPANITAPVTVRIYFSKVEYDALKAADNSIASLNDLRIIKVASNICLTSLNGSTSVIVPSASGVFGTYGGGYYLEFSTSSFSTFFITSAISAGTLPQHLISFEGALQQKSVSLNWKTVNEINVQQYVIERSGDGSSFMKLGSVAGNNAIENLYAFTDAQPQEGKSFYRLRMIDKDGSFTYSKTVIINNNRETVLQLTPNPVTNQVMLTHPKAKAGTIIQIIAADGKKVINKTVSTGSVQTTINASSLAAGFYQLLFIEAESNYSIPFLKQ